MKALLAIALLLSSSLALAQSCDLTLNMNITYKGEPVAKSSITYFGFDDATMKDMTKRQLRVVDAGSKAQDKKGGNYTVTLGDSRLCGAATTASPGVEFQGLTIQGVTQVFKAMQKEGDALVKLADDQHSKGKKRAWGKE